MCNLIGNPDALVTQNLMTARWHLCLYCYNFEDIEYILKVFNLIMWSFLFRFYCKSVQFFKFHLSLIFEIEIM